MRRDEVTLGPVQVPDGVLVLRSPRPHDAAAWSAARLANREWLEPAFPAWGDDWPAEQGETAWVQRWWRLSRAARRGRAKPFVILLDGVLVGEIGIDAVDPVSGAGEASVWMTRSHGSAAVMGAASLLLIHEAFTDAHPIDLLLSPVATSSRRGRSPGLTAAGLHIEGTYPRKVGTRGLVDHDMWVVRNTPSAIGNTASLLRRFPPVDAVAEPPARLPPAALARAAVREGRSAVRGRLSRGSTDGSGPVRVAPDPGTGIAELVVTPARTTDAHVRTTMTDALSTALAEVAAGRYGAGLHPAVRVPADAALPDAELLAALGLRLTATFAGNPDGPRRWRGEQRWEPVPD